VPINSEQYSVIKGGILVIAIASLGIQPLPRHSI
jgi:hypothetical protein